MKHIKKWILAILVLFTMASFTSLHKFYVSVTNVVYSEKDSAFQVKTRIFIDDLENVLKERYDVQLGLATDRESKESDTYIEKYLRAKFALTMNGASVPFEYLGKKYDDDVVICYIEVPNVVLDSTETMSIQNEILTDIFEEQKNIVHVKWRGNKKSFVLIRDNNKGMLNL